MPSMADITVKKNDAVTNITYTALVPSSGDGVHAVWRSESVGSAAGHKPVFEVWSRWNAARTVRRVEFSFTYPQIATDSTTSLTSVVNRAPITGSFALPTAMTATDINEAVSQCINLLASTLFVATAKAGYAPT